MVGGFSYSVVAAETENPMMVVRAKFATGLDACERRCAVTVLQRFGDLAVGFGPWRRQPVQQSPGKIRTACTSEIFV